MSTNNFNNVTNTEQLIWVVDKNDVFTYVSDGFCQVAKCTKEQLLGMKYHQVFHQQLPRAVIDEIKSSMSKGFSWQGMLQQMWLVAKNFG